MSNTSDRRAPGACRIPFDAMVEVGGALGPSFEAQAINLSEEGMSLRTAYLPEVGQPVMCRFDTGNGMGIVAAGEVLWKDDMGNGGEFGIRFTNLDGPSTVALQRLLGMGEDGQMARGSPTEGRKVRLHIEGLASPMRARIREQMAAGVTAYSDLGFLQMGRPLELEDASSGNRRPALIDRVEVAVDEASRIPQLVVSLRYDDAEGRAAMDAGAPIHEMQHTPQDPAAGQYDRSYGEAAEMHGEGEDEMDYHAPNATGSHAEIEPMAVEANATLEGDEESGKLKNTLARNAAKVTPAILAWVKRAKTTAALLAAKARKSRDTESDVPMRRTTAPAPGGGLHAAGRKVVRGSMPDTHFEEEPQATSRFKITKKKIAVAGSLAIATGLVAIALHKPAPAPQLASAPEAVSASVEPSPAALGNAPPPMGKPIAPPTDPLTAAAMANAKPGKATPFVNGSVGSHPNVIKIKMDGPIEGIQGAPQPTGFTIVIPNRKTAEPATSLAEKDPRISSVNVSNEAGGAEFSVSFKDGVPPYMVRAHGDTLEMVLAKSSAHGDKAEASAKKKRNKKH
jgi:hypothetical protein